MAGLRFADLQSRPLEFLDFTSLTLEEFQQLVSSWTRVRICAETYGLAIMLDSARC
jgi:hypothetical protein